MSNWTKIFFLTLCVLFQACSSYFLEEVDKSISDSYFYMKESGEIVYSPGGEWSGQGYESLDADRASFKPIARDFGKDKDHFFYKAKKLPKVDYATFMEEAVIQDTEQIYAIHRFDIETAASSGHRAHKYARTGKTYGKNPIKD